MIQAQAQSLIQKDPDHACAAPDFLAQTFDHGGRSQPAEDLESAHTLNAAAPSLLAADTRALCAAFVHYSTDFVFDGEKGAPYVEADTPNPLGAYGRTKLEGERAVEAAGGSWITPRTVWVYSTRRPSFVTKVLGWVRKFPELRIVTDQVGSPT